jgi:hypothetical protein
MALPNNGDLNWGSTLNAQIQSDEGSIATVVNNLANHLLNNPADPHGDRAYASALVTPITTGTNLAPTATTGGYVVLDGTGHVPKNLLPSAGGTNNWYDVRNAQFGATGTGTTDDSAAINAALSAASAAGSGVVWIPAGLYGIGSSLVIGSGTLLLLAPGATIQRISPVAAPTVMLKNYSTGVSAATGNFTVMGGTWDAYGTTHQTGANTIFSFVNASQVIIENTVLNQVCNSAYGEFYGCTSVSVMNVQLTGQNPAFFGFNRAGILKPCFKVEQTHATNIAGLVFSDYNHQMCNAIYIENCSLQANHDTDGDGDFTGWHSMCATTGFIDDHTRFHTNIKLISCDATALAHNGILGLNWNNVSFINCLFGTPRDGMFSQTWVTVPPATIVWSNQDTWHGVTYQNGWGTGQSGSKLGYQLLPDGLVKLSGIINSAPGTGTIKVATIPSTHAPKNRSEYFMTLDMLTGNTVVGFVDTSGNIFITVGSIGANNLLIIDTMYASGATFLT